MPQAEVPPNQLSYSQTEAMLAEAKTAYDQSDFKNAFGLIERIHLSNFCPPGTFYLKALCYERVNWPTQSLQMAQAELLVQPDHAGAGDLARRMNEKIAVPGTDQPTARPWTSALLSDTVNHLEQCSRRYVYRGIPMIKNAFDLAIYPMMFWNIKPATIIEVGSFLGASAVWMADITGSWGLNTHIYSVDVTKVWTAKHDRVTFIQGDGNSLGKVFSDEMLAALPRPLLVIEDADHSYATTKAVLDFFHTRLRDGEYIIVEDTMTMPRDAGRALHEFLAANPTEYLVDRQYCDFFGSNVTWCVNGFLKRINTSP